MTAGSTALRPPWMPQASRWLLALGIAGSALAVGTVHTITLCIVTGVLATAAVLGWWGAEPMRARAPATLLLFTGIGLTLYTALQCVPMPIGWLAVIAPHNADVWSRALSPLHEPGPSWAPITLDPIATRVEVLKGVAYLLAFVTALRVARRKEGVGFLSAVIVVTGVALALAAVLHPAFGVKRLFGVYEAPAGIAERHIAPLMNANNLAGYLTLALCLALASLLAPEPRVPRPIAGVVVLLLVAAQAWIASRGGVATMVLGALIVLGIARVTRTRERGAVLVPALIVGAVMIAGATLVVLSGQDEVSSELLDTNISKLKMFTMTLRSLPAMPWLGCGRGAFESVFPAFRVDPGYVTYAYPENFIAQWVVEWGLPVGIAGLALTAFGLRPNVVLARSALGGGAWAGIVAVAVQNLADLGTEVPGLMLSAVVCAGIVSAGTSGNDSRWRVGRWARSPGPVAVVAGAGAAAAFLTVASVIGGELHADQRALHNAAQSQASVAAVHVIARSAMSRHPSEPYFPFVTSLRAARERDEDPMPWIAATLERTTVYGPAHFVLARVVASRSPSQARMEYRMAMEQAPNLIGNIMAEAPRVVDHYFEAAELVPDGNGAIAIRELLVRAIKERLPATAARLDADQLAYSPLEYGPTLRSATAAVEDLEAEGSSPWCLEFARQACVSDATTRTGRLKQLAPDKCDGFVLSARARSATGDPAGGVTELAKAADAVTDRLSCLQQLVDVASKAGDTAHAEAALEKIVTVGCGDAATCAQNLRWVAREYEWLGRPHKALALYRRAFDLAPDDVVLGHMADLAAAGGFHVEAAGDYERLARRHPDNPRWQQLAGAQRNAAMLDTERP